MLKFRIDPLLIERYLNLVSLAHGLLNCPMTESSQLKLSLVSEKFMTSASYPDEI